jgi:hypothetical protein
VREREEEGAGGRWEVGAPTENGSKGDTCNRNHTDGGADGASEDGMQRTTWRLSAAASTTLATATESLSLHISAGPKPLSSPPTPSPPPPAASSAARSSAAACAARPVALSAHRRPDVKSGSAAILRRAC